MDGWTGCPAGVPGFACELVLPMGGSTAGVEGTCLSSRPPCPHNRGFAFVEMSTRQEAQNAMDSLKSTHLYGRHLVIERAKEGEDLEDLREKTADKVRKAEEFLEGGRAKKKGKKSQED